MASESLREFESSADAMERKITDFKKTADLTSREHSGPYDQEVDELERKWVDFRISLTGYRRDLDESLMFFQLSNNVSNVWEK